MAWYDNLFGRKAAPAPKAKRNYEAAIVNRLTSSWTTTNLSANADVFRGLDTLRARSRDLFNNNDYAKKFGNMVATNVVGPNGFTLQARVYNSPGKPDTGANDAIENAFAKWAKRGVCDVSGQLSFLDIQHLLIKAAARDGEFMVRIIRGKSADNKFGFALQLLDIDRLDTQLNRDEPNGNTIKMGVEVNAFGKPVSYWLKTVHPGDMWSASGIQGQRYQRIPADEIIHRGIADRPEQVRFVPWMHAAMSRLQNLGAYEEAAVINSRVGASSMGFFVNPNGDLTSLADSEDTDGTLYHDADPGTFGTLPPGYDFKPFNPTYPQAMYAEFVNATLRGISSGLNVAYHSLANDLTSVSFSSIRSGTLEERDQWMVIQQWFIGAFLEPVFDEWLKFALATGQVILGNGSPLPMEKIDKFGSHQWQGRRWEWVDPLKDIEADIAAINAGLKAPQDIAAKMGLDYEDVLVKIKQAQDMAEKIGVVLPSTMPPAPAPAPDAENSAEVKAAKIAADAAVRSAELHREAVIKATPAPAPAPVINVEAPVINMAPTEVNVGASRADVEEIQNRFIDQLTEQVTRATDMPINVVVNVPEQAAPVVNVNVEPTPITMEANIEPEVIVAMPSRKTETTIRYNADGDMIGSTSVESDI